MWESRVDTRYDMKTDLNFHNLSNLFIKTNVLKADFKNQQPKCKPLNPGKDKNKRPKSRPVNPGKDQNKRPKSRPKNP